MVLVVLDTVRADFLQPYGEQRATSPFLVELAKQGVTFANAYATSGWTVPSMASMMTGVYPSEHGLVSSVFARGDSRQPVLPEDADTLAERMQAGGYETFAVCTNAFLTAQFGFGQGFDHFAGDAVGWMPFPRLAVESMAPARARSGKYFLWLHYFDPHWPYTEHAPWFQMWNDSRFENGAEIGLDAARWTYRLQRELPPDAPVPPADMAELLRIARLFHLEPMLTLDGIRTLGHTPAGVKLRDDYTRFLRAAYRSQLRAVDRDLERVLRGMGLDDDTLLIVTSDHGEEILDRGRLGHSLESLHQELIRVPLFVRLPQGRAGGEVITTPVSLVDLIPTMLELLKLPPADDVSGESFASLLEGPPPATARKLIAEYRHVSGTEHRAVLRHPWKYVHDFQTGSGQLFDLSADPAELEDHAASEPERAAELRTWLLDWVANAKPRWQEAPPVELTPAQIMELRAVGYAGADSSAH